MATYSRFEAIPPHLRTTIKVKPFSLVPFAEQLAQRPVDREPIVHELRSLASDPNLKAAIVGGSRGKGLDDEHSDLDVGVVADDIDAAIEAIIAVFGASSHREDKTTSLALHYPSRGTAFDRFEIRVSSTRTLVGFVERVKDGAPLSQIEQDFVANYQRGRLLFASAEVSAAIREIVYTEAQAQHDIEKNRELVVDYSFQKLIERGDYTLYFYYLSVCKRALINLIYAQNRVFHLGYKHEKKIRALLPAYPAELVDALDRCFTAPTIANVHDFFTRFEAYDAA